MIAVAIASKTAAQTLAYFEKNYPQINITPEQVRNGISVRQRVFAYFLDSVC
jgi:hypothetical protein